MIESEKLERKKIAEDFQGQMAEVTSELEQKKEARKSEYEENEALRKQI